MIGTRHNLNSDYSKEGLIHLFWEVRQALKKQPKKRGYAMSKIYQFFENQQKPYAWDYVSYGKNYLKERPR